MTKTDLTNLKQLLELYKTYTKQSSETNRTIYSIHDDSGPGDPDYHCDTHDNYVTSSKIKIKTNEHH